ncbi:MAG: hypothetical protein RLZZ515_2561 [Cyanobacteriota bacterium]|jgi:hypothetical protein
MGSKGAAPKPGFVDLLDHAYERRQELLAQSGVRWVRMHLERGGVTLTLELEDGSTQVEVLPRT